MRAMFLVPLLFLLACSTTEETRKKASDDLTDTTAYNQRSDIELLIQDQRHLSRVVGMDTILCARVSGANGRIYFDEPLWANLSTNTKRKLTECLDLKRNLQVQDLPKNAPVIKMWTARLNQEESRLLVGTVASNCNICQLSEGYFEYELIHQDTVYAPRLFSDAELWK